MLRDELARGRTGRLWLSDLYRAIPMGVGPDDRSGHPLVAFHLDGADIKAGMEFLHLSRAILNNSDFFVHVAGMRVGYRRTGPVFRSVTQVEIGDQHVVRGVGPRAWRCIGHGSRMGSTGESWALSPDWVPPDSSMPTGTTTAVATTAPTAVQNHHFS